MIERVHVVIAGRVQGVGFRFSTQHRALELGLTGWVRNLPDGRVEAEFEGQPDAVEAMVAWCRHGPALSRVNSLDVQRLDSPCGYGEFAVR
jgi:acylphosphatase